MNELTDKFPGIMTGHVTGRGYTLSENHCLEIIRIFNRLEARAEKAEAELRDWRTGKIAGIEFVPRMVDHLEGQILTLQAALEQAREAIDALITTGNDLEAHEADPALRPWYAACHVGYAAIAALDAAGEA